MADLSILSLCAGIGGLDEAVRIVLPAARVVCRVEREAYCVEVMARRDQEEGVGPVPCWSDLHTFDGTAWRGVDIIIGGYPCQPFSFAGQRRGQDDPRHLWPQVARVIAEAEPGIVFLENVAGHLSLGFDVVWGDLRRMGYRVTAGLFTAAETGAPHKRTRLFILAVRDDAGPGAGERGEQGDAPGLRRGGLADNRIDVADAAQRGRGELRESSGGDRQPDGGNVELADAEGPRHEGPEPAGRAWTRRCAAEHGGTLENTSCESSERNAGTILGAEAGIGSSRELNGNQPERFEPTGPAMADPAGDGRRIDEPGRGSNRRTTDIEAGGECLPIFPPGPGDIDAWRNVLAIRPDLAPALPPVHMLADGVSTRLDELRAIGNAVCPIQGAYAFVSLWACLCGDE